MKELSIEEKSRRYDKIKDRAEKELNSCGSQDCDAARQIFRLFPELKESEDEKIRKGLIAMLSQDKELHSKEITWLEKQELVEQDTETRDLWEYIKEWREKFGRLPKDEDELAACIDYVIKRQKFAVWSKEDEENLNAIIEVLGNNAILVQWFESLKDRIQPQPK